MDWDTKLLRRWASAQTFWRFNGNNFALQWWKLIEIGFEFCPPIFPSFCPQLWHWRCRKQFQHKTFLWKLFQTINFIPPFNKFSRWILTFFSLPGVKFDWQFDGPLMMTGLQILDFSSICFLVKLSQNFVGQNWAGSQSFLNPSHWNCRDSHWE